MGFAFKLIDGEVFAYRVFYKCEVDGCDFQTTDREKEAIHYREKKHFSTSQISKEKEPYDRAKHGELPTDLRPK